MTDHVHDETLPATQHLERPMTAAEVTAQSQVIHSILTHVMVKGVHYGEIPGVDKPTLLQPGAEKICATFRLAPKYDVEDLSEPAMNLYRYRVKCSLYSIRDGYFVGSAVGEASSAEEKYQWERAVCTEHYETTDPTRRRIKFKRAGGQIDKIHQVQRNAADLANTVLKMAVKRAYISATRSATAASDLLNVDLDEEAVVNMVREEQAEQAATKPVARAVKATPLSPTIAYGKFKGKALNDQEVPDDYLAWMLKRERANLDDPNRAKFREQNLLFVAAIEAELQRRAELAAPPEESAPPADARPPMDDAAWQDFCCTMETDYPQTLQAYHDRFAMALTEVPADRRWIVYDWINAQVSSGA